MACSPPSFSMGYPLGGSVQISCFGGASGTLSTAYGNVTTNCRSTRVRGRINGEAWVETNVSPMNFGGTYIASWTLRDIPGATCDNNPDILEVEVEVTDPVTGAVSWLPGNPVTFSAYCFMMSPPMRLNAAKIFYLELSKLIPPTMLWGIVGGKLVAEQSIKLKRSKGSAKGDIGGPAVWKSFGTAEGLWTLTLSADKRAQLLLKVKGKVGGATYVFEFSWGCGNFSATKGGLFGPVGDNPIAQVLSVSGKLMPLPTARAKARARPKAKAKPARKKRRGRR